MIKKLLFSLVCVLTLCLTFVTTKVSADTPEGYDLAPIYINQKLPYGTKLYYNTLSSDTNITDTYIFHVVSSNITYAYSIYVSEGEWEVSVYDNFGTELTINYYTTDYFTLETIENGPSVSGNFTCVGIETEEGLGKIGTLIPSSTESNVIYSGIFELLADTLYGETENLTQTQIGLIEWFSILITICCLLLPFIIVFFVIKLLFK